MDTLNPPIAPSKPLTANVPKQYQLRFLGEGGALFAIQIVNLLLMIVTLGLYYPWAKAKTLRYIYGATEFEGSTLQFHGTGAEMFKGFIKAILIIAAIYAVPFGILMAMNFENADVVAVLFLY